MSVGDVSTTKKKKKVLGYLITTASNEFDYLGMRNKWQLAILTIDNEPNKSNKYLDDFSLGYVCNTNISNYRGKEPKDIMPKTWNTSVRKFLMEYNGKFIFKESLDADYWAHCLKDATDYCKMITIWALYSDYTVDVYKHINGV